MDKKVIINGLNNFIIKRIASPFIYRRNFLKKSQWYDSNQLERLQLNRVKHILNHAYQTTAYYKKVMDQHDFNPNNINTLSDINRLPLLTKADILQNTDELISDRYPRSILRIASTGGTTGTPLKIYRSPFSIGNEHAFVRRQWDWAGLNFSAKTAYLSGRLFANAGTGDGKEYAYDPFMREVILSTFHLTKANAINYVNNIKKLNVKGLIGYPSAIAFLAKDIISRNETLPLNAVLTTSEVLSEGNRQAIDAAFNCKVYDFYGAAERVCYIQTCEHGTYHLIPEYGYTEFIPVDGIENRYKIVSTGFWNMAMPLIRFDTGDMVEMQDTDTGECQCGRKFPIVKKIYGRDGDIVKTISGKEFGVTSIIHMIHVLCGTSDIIESQVVQTSIDSIQLRYVPTGELAINKQEELVNKIQNMFQNEIQVELVKVQNIEQLERTKSGKLKSIISKI